MSFIPPGVDSLFEIDIAEGVAYDGESAIVRGVVSGEAQGATFATFRDLGNYKVHHITLAAWHRQGEPIQRRDLAVLRPLPTDVADYFNDFPAYSVQCFRLLISTDGERAVLEEVLQIQEPTDEFSAIAAELQKPVVVSTELFGDLALNRRFDHFEGEGEWNGEPVDVIFTSVQEQPAKSALDSAEKLWANQRKWTIAIGNAVVSELLETKNDDWLEEGEAAITSDEFLERLELTSISFSRDGEWEFAIDDGDLFWGHMITVRGNMLQGILAVGLHG